ncbi:Type IV pilus biogenesis and competence protein PilQ precursor [Rubripirellula amarantea]|uniref:Type IV pilus biogenesis and competence protein PilQ n=1 Tax=Rubripirellula amarantea TaxID=2527999 RepID=A0A5C5WW20_9BACT|nr:hypothetical protein [Rubripirellula amarantea]TWT54331.1 Type IV pilus biogenesis and competence protein PilQ precursor [Rubripirellula amarantea]
MKKIPNQSAINDGVTAVDQAVAMEQEVSASNSFGNLLTHHAPAVIWILVAWIVGTLILELNATGAEPYNFAPISQQWQQIENDSAITHSGIVAFERIERESRLRPVFEAMIAQSHAEQSKLAAAKEKAATEAKELALSKQRSSRRETEATDISQSTVAATAVAKSSESQSSKSKTTIAKSEPKASEAIASSTSQLASNATVNRDADPANDSQAFPQFVQQVVHSFQELMGPVNVAPIPTEHDDSPQRPAVAAESSEATSQLRRTADSANEVNSTTPAQPVVPGTNAATSFVDSNMDRDRASNETVSDPVPSADAKIIRVAAKPVMVPEATVSVAKPTATNESSIEMVAETANEVRTLGAPTNKVEDDSDADSEPSVGEEEEHIAARWPILGAATVATTQKVTLNVDKADVRGVLEMLARGYQMNILVSPEVNGTVTANVEGLSPEQTLDGIVKMCNLNVQRDGDLIYVYPDTNLPADARQLQVFPLDFARAEALEQVVQGLLSPVGNAYVNKISDQDNRQTRESLVVVDIPAVLSQVEQYVFQADQAPRQVMIEASILEVELKDDMMHGLNFDSVLGGDLKVGSFGLADPIASKNNPLFFAQVDGSKVSALLDFIETTTDSKTLANPRVQVINGQVAKIQVGQQLGFTVATVTQTATIQDVQFLETGVVLSVTPTISRDNRILMQVKPEVSDGKINPDTLLPEEVTREVETSVLLDDHQGVVIGGLIQEKDSTIIRKLPWLGDVKYIGKLFQRRETERNRTEIIVALTCHIIEPTCYCDREAINVERATQPLFEGLLQRTCRPWEPRMPDQVGSERHLDVNQVNRRIP